MSKVFARPKVLSKRSVFYGWWIVAAGALNQAYSSGTVWQGFGAFFDPIVAEFGWSRAATSGAVSLQNAEQGVISPFVGFFVDRFGPKNVMLGGIVATGFGFILLSRINSLWQFYAAFALITIGLSFGTFIVVTTTVANWFVERRGRALAIMSAGSGLGGLLVPLVVWMISATDWRSGLVIIGVGFWLMGIPVALVMRRRPEDHGMLPDGAQPAEGLLAEGGEGQTAPRSSVLAAEADFTVKEALHTWTFWQFALAMGAGMLVMLSSVHLIPAMTSFGVGRGTAGLILMGVSLVSLTGRLGSGFLGELMDKRKVIALALACQLVGMLIFAYSTATWHLVIFMLFWGFGFGASIPLRFAMLADFYGRRSFGSLMGLMMTISTMFGVAGPIFVGWMFDVRGNYRDPYLILSFTVLIGIPLILTLRQPNRPLLR